MRKSATEKTALFETASRWKTVIRRKTVLKRKNRQKDLVLCTREEWEGQGASWVYELLYFTRMKLVIYNGGEKKRERNAKEKY